MNVATLTMPADQARQKFDEYRAALDGKEPTPEDTGIMLGYQALAAGKALLNLPTVLRAGPVDDEGMPRLAAARAHWRWCHLRLGTDGGAFCEGERIYWTDRRTAWHRTVRFPAGTIRDPKPGVRLFQRRALVPLIPPNLRPARGLNRYVILFEAEWKPIAPKDPLLLRHLHGDLYTVLAAWDLTELERAVLAGRLADRPT